MTEPTPTIVAPDAAPQPAALAGPLTLVAAWLAEAKAALPIPITLATATRDGRPSARMLHLERFDQRGCVFSSNAASRKGVELADNPRAALVLYLPAPLPRQVRVQGRVWLLGRSEAGALFAARERHYQLMAYLPQDRPVAGHEALTQQLASLQAAHADDEVVPLPRDWASYLLVPETLELFEEGEDRLGRRDCYRLAPDGRWESEQLTP
jgi:pyridoxamine 5'-phosphate oxidase